MEKEERQIKTNSTINQLLVDLILPRLPQAGDYNTPIKGFVLHRRDVPNKAENCFNKPIVSITVQGYKRSLIGNEEYEYGAGFCFVAGVDIPSLNYLIQASSAEPYLSLSLDLDSHLTTQLIEKTPSLTLSQPVSHNDISKRIAVMKTEDTILNAFLRLTHLLEQPEQIPFLAPLIIQEIHYRLLMSKQGEQLRAINTIGAQSNRIFQIINQMRANIGVPHDINDLANLANMSLPSFRKHFKSVTSMTALQYYKHMCLYEAQRLMLVEHYDVQQAAHSVGYESTIHFYREYKRLFGEPPQKNIEQLR